MIAMYELEKTSLTVSTMIQAIESLLYLRHACDNHPYCLPGVPFEFDTL